MCEVYKNIYVFRVRFDTDGLWLTSCRPLVPTQKLLKAFPVNLLFVVYINEDSVTEF